MFKEIRTVKLNKQGHRLCEEMKALFIKVHVSDHLCTFLSVPAEVSGEIREQREKIRVQRELSEDLAGQRHTGQGMPSDLNRAGRLKNGLLDNWIGLGCKNAQNIKIVRGQKNSPHPPKAILCEKTIKRQMFEVLGILK